MIRRTAFGLFALVALPDLMVGADDIVDIVLVVSQMTRVSRVKRRVSRR
jgi:hypothetical protein